MKSTSSSGIGVSSSFALTVIIAMKPITATGVPIAAPELSDNGMCTRPADHRAVHEFDSLVAASMQLMNDLDATRCAHPRDPPAKRSRSTTPVGENARVVVT